MADHDNTSIYFYNPSHALAAVFTVLVGMSLLLHIYQNFRYRFWRVTFFMFWAGVVFTAGWLMRILSTYNPSNVNLWIAQNVLILAGPPIYSAAEYNVLGRLMHYVPMHAPLNPNRLTIFFIYCGAAVESWTGAGAAMKATSSLENGIPERYRTGGLLMSIALVFQGVVELGFISMVAIVHHQCARAGMLPHNVRRLCIMLYATSALIIFRCIFRAIESFGTEAVTSCGSICRLVAYHEWYLYVFEAAPMVLYSYWINMIHPGQLLPSDANRYLDIDGRTERQGPGWIDRRSTWQTFADPFDLVATSKGKPSHEAFWMKADDWPVAIDGSFADGTASNIRNHRRRAQQSTLAKVVSTT